MTKEERLKMYKEATELWGWIAQVDQMIEESAELIVALNKYKRKHLYNERMEKDLVDENLFVELADVSICLEQMIDNFGQEKVNEKIDDQLKKFQKQIDKMKKA